MSSNLLNSNAAANAAVVFEPSNKDHRAAYAHFVTKKRWPENVRFVTELPYTNAIETVKAKLALHAIHAEMQELIESQPQSAAA